MIANCGASLRTSARHVTPRLLASPSTQHGRTAAYRRLSSLTTSTQLKHTESPLSSLSPPWLSIASSRPFSPLLALQTNSFQRLLHTSNQLRQQAQPKEDPKDPKDSESSSGEQGKSGDEQKTGSEEQKSDESKSEEKKKADAAPPPPHGDKTPWQVFTETLSKEFKASKEWNDSTKQLTGQVQTFTESEAVRRAREASGFVSGATGQAIKTTASAVGKSAAWTWNTSAVQGIRAGVNATGRGIEQATRPVRETETFKNMAKAIDDGSSARYGGWTEKEERRRRREERELEELKSGKRKRVEKIEEDPNAGTNVTVHKDAAWKESWSDFKEKNPMMQRLFAMRQTYEESENPLISTARSITDRIAGFFAENETARVIKKFREMDPEFQIEPFLREMREYILPEVLDAYVKADVETLKLWLSAAQFQVYSALMEQYTKAGLRSDGRILDIRHVDILNARMLEPGDIPVFIITCRTQEVHVYRNAKTNQLAAGMEDRVQLVTYAIGVTRLPDEVNNPETRGWRMIELQKAARDYL